MFGTRADFIVDFAYLITLVAPLVAFYSLLLVRRGEQEAHRRAQLILFSVCVLAVVALEIRIRLAGGSGALLEGGPYGGSGLMRVVATVHIFGAVLTYVLWCWLVIASRRRHRSSLPGTFSRKHKITGRIVIGGLCFTTLSASVVYTLAFVA
jgi:hypothetical protein